MKKNEKYYAVNNQEDEDGYAPYPANEVIDDTEKKKENSSPDNNTANSESCSPKIEFRRFIYSHSAIQKRDTVNRLE